ncbi:hypothetical protein BH23GEM10_BH23GEM10_00220 [soil metagenome]
MDVFSRLAARAVGDVPVLRPRPLSRFAPAPLAPGEAARGHAEVSWDAAGHEGRAPDHDAASAAQSAAPLLERRVAPVTESQRARAATDVDAARPPVTAAAAIAANIAVARLFAVTPPDNMRAGSGSRTDALAHQPAHGPVELQHRPAPLLREASPVTTDRASIESASSRPAAPRFADTHAPPPLRPPMVAPTDVAPASPAVTDARPAAVPLLKSSMPAAAAVLSPDPQHATPPRITPAPAPARQVPPAAEAARVIEITIGRVEVRAMRPPSPVRAPQPPRLSLDEYMRQRPGGGG